MKLQSGIVGYEPDLANPLFSGKEHETILFKAPWNVRYESHAEGHGIRL
jgi:hypothetical protein